MYLPTYHPLKGIHLMKIGKIQLLTAEKPRVAIETLYQVRPTDLYLSKRYIL